MVPFWRTNGGCLPMVGFFLILSFQIYSSQACAMTSEGMGIMFDENPHIINNAVVADTNIKQSPLTLDDSNLFFYPTQPTMTVSRQEVITVNHGYLDMPRLGKSTGTPHQYIFYITAHVTGPVQPGTGMVIDMLDFIKIMRRILHLPALQIPVPEDQSTTIIENNKEENVQLTPKVHEGETHIFLDMLDDDNVHRLPATAEHFCLWFYRKLNSWVKQMGPDIKLSKITIESSQHVGTTCYG